MTDNIFRKKFLPGLLAREGGARYTNHPADRGGPTKYGVTAATLGRYRRLGRAATPAEVQALTEAEASQLYETMFYIEPGYNLIAEVSEHIAEELIDTGVNMGTGIPGEWLQRSLNVMNREGRDYPDIGVDGDIGNRTKGALESLIRVRGREAAEDCILKLLNGLQVVRYLEITERRGPNEAFMLGWLRNRVGL